METVDETKIPHRPSISLCLNNIAPSETDHHVKKRTGLSKCPFHPWNRTATSVGWSKTRRIFFHFFFVAPTISSNRRRVALQVQFSRADIHSSVPSLASAPSPSTPSSSATSLSNSSSSVVRKLVNMLELVCAERGLPGLPW